MTRSVALVTGASAGIGRAYAEQLANAGYNVVLVARRADRLEQLAAKLRATGSTVEVLAADLTDRAGLARVEARAAADDMSMVINNAGFGGYQAFATLDPAIADQLIDVHVRATTRIARAALGGFVARDSGAVINVASLLAFSGTLPAEPLPKRAVYGAAKAYIVAFTQLLAGELANTKVRVQVCCPGVVATEFHDVQGMDLSRMPRMSADDVARASLVALSRNEVVCVPALEDPSVIDKIGEAQRAAMGAARTPELAARYR